MLNIDQVRELIIVPALETLQLYSKAAEQLVLGTGLVESNLTHLKQLGDGPALGLWQMEPATHDDIWLNYLAYKPELTERLQSLGPIRFPLALVGNLWYAAAMCRIHYYRVPNPLPAEDDIEAQAAYWRRHYNTPAGKGTEAKYINIWHRRIS